ncbi:MAG: DNA primase [Alphaproteobacteria bacterium]|nr:DNA primase [Alphaproteobacteria bacterium]
MRFSDHILDDIRARLPISEVVGRKVTWDRRKSVPAKGDHWACCPFHGEKTPSFHADDRRGRYHCFGCKESGDIFTFVTKTDGLNFPEAVQMLADLAGVDLPKPTAQDAEREQKRATLYDVMELAAKFFENNLQNADGSAARGYLSDRGLSAKTQQDFRIGYAPNDRRALKSHLAANDVSPEQMAESGLIISGPDISVPYDRFRDRVMFPIRDMRGRVIAFGGRALSADAQAKYLNSPEGPLFHKSNVLYNFDTARSAAYEAGNLVVCEGYMDVIALVRAGYANAVAPLGTALTQEQLRLMWKAVPEPVLCFDGDIAGRKAAFRAVDTALALLQPGYSLKFALLPEGQDPDDLITEGGRAAIEKFLENATPLAAMLWERELETSDLTTPERRADFEQRLFEAVRQVGDERVRAHYSDHIQTKLKELWGSAGTTRPPRPRRQKPGRQAARWSPGRGSHARPWDMQFPPSQELKRLVTPTKSGMGGLYREQLLLLALVNHPYLVEEKLDLVADLEFSNQDLDSLRREILDVAALQAPLETALLRDHLAQRGYSNILGQLDAGLSHKSDWFVQADAAKADVETGWSQLVVLHMKALMLNKELMAAELALAEEATEENLAALNEVREQLRSQAGEEATIEGFGEASGRATVISG